MRVAVVLTGDDPQVLSRDAAEAPAGLVWLPPGNAAHRRAVPVLDAEPSLTLSLLVTIDGWPRAHRLAVAYAPRLRLAVCDRDPARLSAAVDRGERAVLAPGAWSEVAQLVTRAGRTGLGVVLPISYGSAGPSLAAARRWLGAPADLDDAMVREVVVTSDQALGQRIEDASRLGLGLVLLAPVPPEPAEGTPRTVNRHAIRLAVQLNETVSGGALG
ncbi:MAG: hypothetical protein ACM30G_06895 [Micromonosporaceae bacterium]